MIKQVAETKIKHHIPVRDQKREEQLLVRLIKEGKKIGLDPHYVTQIFHVVIEDDDQPLMFLSALWDLHRINPSPPLDAPPVRPPRPPAAAHVPPPYTQFR